MDNSGQEGMYMDAYSFMGMHWFWWGSILIFALLILVAAHLYRRRKK